ncbi:MAG: transporter substrate-binding domain-containing protein [Porticoccus sp.]
MNLSRALGFTLLTLILFFHGSIHAQEKVTIQFKWKHQFQFAGYYAAIEKGFYTDEGLDVELRERNPPTSHIDDVLDGRAQYGVADAGLLLSRMQGKPVVLLAQIFQHSPLVLITLKKSGIRSPYDLMGKRIMFDNLGHGDTPIRAMVLNTMGGFEGIEIQPISFRDGDLIEGKVDAFLSYITDQPFKYREQGAEINILDPRDYGVDFYGDNLFTTEEEIRKHPQRVERLRKATLKGWQYALENPDEIIDMIIEKYNSGNQSRAYLEYQARETEKMVLPEFVEIGSFEATRFDKIAETYASLDVTQNIKVDPRFFYHSDKPVLSLTPKEMAWLDEHPIVRFTGDPDWLPQGAFTEDGTYTGVVSEMLNLLESRLGIKIERVPSKTWSDAVRMIETREVDILSETSGVKRQGLTFTDSHLKFPVAIIVRSGSTSALKPEDLHGRRVAVVRDYGYVKKFQKQYPDLDYIAVDTVREGILSVSSGRTDAFISATSTASYLMSELGLTNLEFSGDTGLSLDLAFGIRKEWPELVSIINKGLNAIGLARLTAISNQGTKIEKDVVVVTNEEKTWLTEHKDIRLGVDPQWAPFEYLDEAKVYSGMASDYVTVLNERLKINMQTVRGLSWSEVMVKAKSREIDVLPAVMKSAERSEFLNFTKPYISFPMVILMRDDVPVVASIGELKNKSIAVIRGYVTEDLFNREYPNHRLIMVDNIEEAMNMVSEGQVDAFVGNLASIRYMITRLGITNLQVAGTTPHKFELSFAVRKDWPQLVSIIDRSITALSTQEKENIKVRWLNVHIEKENDYTLMWQLLVFFLLVLGIILYWNRKLALEIKQR